MLDDEIEVSQFKEKYNLAKNSFASQSSSIAEIHQKILDASITSSQKHTLEQDFRQKMQFVDMLRTVEENYQDQIKQLKFVIVDQKSVIKNLSRQLQDTRHKLTHSNNELKQLNFKIQKCRYQNRSDVKARTDRGDYSCYQNDDLLYKKLQADYEIKLHQLEISQTQVM